MALFRETADVSVRPATPGDETDVARIQLVAWRTDHGELLGSETLDAVDEEAVRRQWEQAIVAPPSPAHRVLVACAGPRVVGFVASAPDGDAVQLLALEVDPDHRRGGHGSRLLAACVDLARERGATRLVTWVLEGDEPRGRFLAGAGLGPDGARRELASGPDGGTRTVAEARWEAEI
ncbi:GNAT family N-acetyltransferase [Cellulomonas carbonis]|uniref:GNAT family acetyltransferase n=1 Tax=Cellulomonas carbonis T26 TaxID=947969 RepID=A0A0A0BIP8_9CELL|nr:GNAT family N-acetyltransferase [Cellulomonas carbonis]KGM08388.1 GNAT family acetyltransferase [Cellulomonas carbonis T26]GGB97581.1 hypothetical protein GCM10010972_07940 [Cellulomonas carbonis]